MRDDAIRIREATVEDAAALAVLWREFMVFHAARDANLEVREGAEEHWRTWAVGKVEGADSVVAVAEAEGRTIGYCIAAINERSPVFERRRYGEIKELAVTAEIRGRGVGKQIYEFVVDQLKSRGVDWVWLEVSSANEVAGAFWAKRGFEPFLETRQRNI